MPLQPFQQAPRATARSESGRLLGDGHKPCSSAAGEALTGESPPGLEAEDPTPRDTSPRCPGKGVGGLSICQSCRRTAQHGRQRTLTTSLIRS